MAATAKRTTFALTEEDLLVLEAVKAHAGVASTSDAMRVAIRQYLRSEGVDVPKLKKKAKKP